MAKMMKSRIFVAFLSAAVFSVSLLLIVRVSQERIGEGESNEENEAVLEATHAFEGIQWFNNQRAYPSGTIPLEWRTNALQKMRRFGVASAASGISWTSVGPNNLGGRVRSLVINPVNPNTVYCGSVSGGIWKTTNGGAYWFPTGDAASSLVIGSLAMDPSDTNTIYAGTGEGYLNVDALRGIGVLKSTDGGSTWTVLNNFSTLSASGPFYINKLVVQPDTPSILYAALSGVSGVAGGLWKTTNAGASWAKLSVPSTSTACVDLVMDPTNYAVLYASFGLRVTDGIYKTINGGKNWSKLTNGFPPTSDKYHRISLAIAPSNPLILYASVADSLDGTHSIQKTTDGGASWATAALRAPYDSLLHQTHLGNQGWYDNVIAVKPDNPNIVFAGGNDMFISTNGGTNWRMLTYGYSGGSVPFMHVDQHAIVFDPTNVNIIYFGNDGGVYKTVNLGSTVFEVNNNLAITQFYSGAVHPTVDIFYGGSQDIGLMKSGTLPAWTVPFAGDGGTTLVDFSTPSTVYSEYVFLDILKSTNSGANWLQMMNGIPQSGTSLAAGTSDRCDFIAPIAMDPSNSQHLIAGTYRVYTTTNGGGSWASASGDLTGDGGGAVGSSGGIVSALAIAKSSSSTWYAGTGFVFSGYGSGTTPAGYSATKLWVTTNGGVRWDSISKPPLPNRYVRAIAVDPASRDRAFVCYSGYGTGHVFLTTNRGVSWSDVSGNLPDIPVNALAIDPANGSHLVIGTDLGVFESLDDGTSWLQANSGLANAAVIDLDLRSDQYLFATTHGRGMFKSTAPMASPLSPHLTISVHQNSVLDQYIDTYLMSDTATSAASPTMRVLVGTTVSDSVGLNRQDSAGQVFKGSYEFATSGTAILSGTVVNALGNTMYTQRAFQVQFLKQGTSQTVASNDGKAVVGIDGRALSRDMVMMIIPDAAGASDTGIVTSKYAIGPNLSFPAPVTITMSYDPSRVQAGREQSLKVMRQGTTGWTEVASFVDPQAHTVSCQVGSLGTFAVGYGTSAGSSLEPAAYELRQNYPNPFNPSTAIAYNIGTPGKVQIDIFDVRGALVRTLIRQDQQAGGHTAQWDGRNGDDREVSSGVYFYRLTVREGETVRFVSTRKMVLVR